LYILSFVDLQIHQKKEVFVYFRTFLNSFVLEDLSYYFEGIDQVEPLESLCHLEYPWMYYPKTPWSLTDKEVSTGKAIDLLNNVSITGLTCLACLACLACLTCLTCLACLACLACSACLAYLPCYA
jgi:hypothetical protein